MIEELEGRYRMKQARFKEEHFIGRIRKYGM
jgi:hypothetical protein